jgi:putative acyl-CoA dehydrogenase
MRLARAYDDAGADRRETLFKRLATAVSKYWICKRGPAHAHEALEVFGGNGFVEESGMPRLYRESPLNSIWEGSGNVMCLDVLRAMVKSPESLEAFYAEIEEIAASDPRIADALSVLKAELSDFADAESRARRIVERMALTLQGALLVRHGDTAVADAFCASRLQGEWGHAFGTLPAGVDMGAIIERHVPQPV